MNEKYYNKMVLKIKFCLFVIFLFVKRIELDQYVFEVYFKIVFVDFGGVLIIVDIISRV